MALRTLMTRLCLLVLLAPLLTCYHAPKGAEVPTQALWARAGAVLDFWRKEGLPVGDCERRLPALQIVATDDWDTFAEATQMCPPPPVPGTCAESGTYPRQCWNGCAFAVTTIYRDGAWPAALRDEHPLVAIWTGPRAQDFNTLFVHELWHVLERCSGLGEDFRHVDPQWTEVWPKVRQSPTLFEED